MSIDDLSGYLKEGWAFVKESPVYFLAGDLVRVVVNRVFSNSSTFAQDTLKVLGTVALIKVTNPTSSVFKIGALAFATIFANLYLNPQGNPQTASSKTSSKIPLIPELSLIEPAKEIEENYRTQLDQLASGVGGKEKPHAIVKGIDHFEMDRLISQLPLLPAFKDWKFYRFIGEKNDNLLNVQRFLKKNPKSILYFPYSHYVSTEFHDKIPAETIVISRMTHDDVWTSLIKSLYINFKEIKLQPLTHEQCKKALETWVSSLDKTLDPASLEAAVELAFLTLNASGKELSLAKDLIERTSKIVQTSSISILDLWSVYTTMHPLFISPSSSGPITAPTLQPMKSLDEIALIMRKKFNVTLPIAAQEPMEPPAFLIDLNEKMKECPQLAVGNERRIAELKQSIKGLDKTNALLVGSPGVGKTTLLESIAWMIAHNQIEETSPFYGKTIYTLDLNAMMAGTKWLGETNERVAKLFRFLNQNKESILFVDEIQQLIGAGVSHANEMGSIAQLMKPYLLAYGIIVIGATTPEEYKKWVQSDTAAAFGRRFREVRIFEPTEEECVLMLTHLTQLDRFKEAYPDVQFGKGSIKRAVQLMRSVESKIGDPDRTKDFIEKIAGRLSLAENKVITVDVIEKYFDLFQKQSNRRG